MDLSNKVIIIAGAGRGMGSAAAELFAQDGADLVLASRTARELTSLESSLVDRFGANTLTIPTDFTQVQGVERLVSEAMRRFGRIDKLIYTAGAGVLKPFHETTPDDFDRLMDVNVKGAFLLCQSILPVMEKQKHGQIIAVPGILGRAPMSQASAYCASKYALTGMFKALGLEFKRAGIQFSLLHFGGVNSGFWDSITMRVQRDRMLTIEAAARSIHFVATQEGEGVLNELILQPESHQL
jgi:NAD(P)-dependent dehydrogenase (short-subunit alcohol dehydrogenase family)